MEKQKSKKMTLSGLASLMKQGFKANQENMAIMVHGAFQTNQEYMDKKFDAIDKKFVEMKNELKGEIKKVDVKLTTFIRLVPK